MRSHCHTELRWSVQAFDVCRSGYAPFWEIRRKRDCGTSGDPSNMIDLQDHQHFGEGQTLIIKPGATLVNLRTGTVQSRKAFQAAERLVSRNPAVILQVSNNPTGCPAMVWYMLAFLQMQKLGDRTGWFDPCIHWIMRSPSMPHRSSLSDSEVDQRRCRKKSLRTSFSFIQRSF
jgi:hypothetical protein